MKKVFIILIMLFLSGIVFAQTISEVESQINQSIQRNQSEYQRLLDLQQSNFNNRQIVLLQRQHATLRTEIAVLQQEIQRLINQPASRENINNQMTRLRELMREEERMKVRLDALKG